MVAPISQAQMPQAPNKTVKTSIFYVNDVHANVGNMERLKTASDEFDAFVPSENTDKLKFSAGDIIAGRDQPLGKLAVEFQNSTGIMASASGNHEFDLNKEDLSEVLEDAKFKMLGLNAEIPSTNENFEKLDEEIISSYIQEQNGTKYGVIGLFPSDFAFHQTDPDEYKDVKVLTIEETALIVQKEIDKMREQGINKIIVLSHAGYEEDVKLAKTVEGIDVIVGGHTHALLKDVKEGENLFYSTKTGAPTIITQAGKDGRYFGVLNLEFNENGEITKAQNNVNETKNFPKNSIFQYFTDKFLGKPKVYGKINSAPNEAPRLSAEQASADFILDIMKTELNVDIAITNSANLRDNFKPGNLTDRDLAEISPFKNRICIVRLTEQELVDAIKTGAKSFTNEEHVPGILQVSGLKYTITKSGEVKEIIFIDKDGKENLIDINNPNPFKTYRVGTNEYITKGGNNYIPNKYNEDEVNFDFDQDKLIIDYMKKTNKPIDIKADGRITIINTEINNEKQ